METIFCPNEEYTRTKFYGSRTKARCVGCPCANTCIYKAGVEAKILERNKHYLQTFKNVRVMTENRELKMQLLDKFANIEKPETVDFCKAAFDWLADEPKEKPTAEPVSTQVSAVTENKPDGIYLIFESGKALPFDPDKGVESDQVANDGPVKYIGIKWGSRTLAVALHDQANSDDITLTAKKDDTDYNGYIDNYLDAVADWDGKANTEHLKQIRLNKDITLSDNEYIPALGEMLFVFLNRKAVNQALEAVGGTPIDGVWYWTSSESSATYAWDLTLSNGYVTNLTKASHTGRVRPVSAFQL